ncbi:MAG TPA: efflux RND transporter permease subunit [Thermoanaerobaculia bacterium]|nr:efflux RND transporter permease subunit [Thermoanaerobaculia bacterium]
MKILSRACLGAAIVLLGFVAASSLSVGYLPAGRSAEMRVGLSLSELGATDPGELARTWVVDLESSIRALGDVKGIRGRVGSSDAELTVRFMPGADVPSKAARFLADVAALRRRLPAGSSLDVWSASENRTTSPGFAIAIEGSEAFATAETFAEALRRLSDVRSVHVIGGRTRETRVRVATAGEVDLTTRVTKTIEDSLRASGLGMVRALGRERRLVANPTPISNLRNIPIAIGGTIVPLTSVADIQEGFEEPFSAARFNGSPGVALVVYREATAPLLRFDREVRLCLTRTSANFPSANYEIFLREAEPLVVLLRRALAAVLLCAMVLAIAGALFSGLRGALGAAFLVPLALAVDACLLLVLGFDVNVLTILALGIGTAVALPLCILRMFSRDRDNPPNLAVLWTASLLLPVGVALAATQTSNRLMEPASAFVCAVAGAIVAALILPRTHRQRQFKVSRRLAGILRQSPTLLLFSLTAVYIFLTLFGEALIPRVSTASVQGADLIIQMSLPEGTTLAQTASFAAQAEKAAKKGESVRRFWSWINPGSATTFLELLPSARGQEEVETLKQRLYTDIPIASGSILITDPTSPSAEGTIQSDDAMEERARADRDGGQYRMVLRASELGALRSALERIRDRIVAAGIGSRAIRAEWGAASIHEELRPRSGVAPAELGRVARIVRERTLYPSPISLPDRNHVLRVFSPGSPVRRDAIPQQQDLLDRPLRDAEGTMVIRRYADIRERLVTSSISREAGQFVLPVDVGIPGARPEDRREKRKELDRALSVLPIPPECRLERPSLSVLSISSERLRMISLAGGVLALLYALSTVCLDSFALAALALIPTLVALAAASPLLASSRSGLDELALLGLGAVLSGALAISLHLLGALRRTPDPAGVYRLFRHAVPVLIASSIPVAAILMAIGGGLDAEKNAWAPALQVSALAMAMDVSASSLILPAAALSILELRRRRSPAARGLAHPPAWDSPGPIVLTVRSLSKTYRNGFKALKDVSFELRPGIIGLLGPNGAGKTTLLRLLTGLLLPTRGQILYRGVAVVPENLARFRHHIGFLPQELNAYPGFTAEQFLDFWAMERGVRDRKQRDEEVDLLLTAVGLDSDRGRRVRDFSGGMRQRIGIARALIGSPPVLIVDEPTTGLDIEGRSRFRSIMLSIAVHRIVILSTHIAGDVEATSSRLLLVHRGQLRFDGPPEALISRARSRVFEMVVPEGEVRELGRQFRITTRVRVLDGIRVRGVARHGQTLPGPESEPSLEEAYLTEIDRGETLGRSRFDFLKGSESA